MISVLLGEPLLERARFEFSCWRALREGLSPSTSFDRTLDSALLICQAPGSMTEIAVGLCLNLLDK
jgi:hypothetical protein